MANLSDVGTFFSKSDIQGFANNHSVAAKSTDQSFAKLFHENDAESTDVRKAEFFGINAIQKLLATNVEGKKVAGIRIYFGVASEHKNANGVTELHQQPHPEGKMKPRMFLVAVDEKGNDIDFDLSGLKDGPGGTGLGNGEPCPTFCNKG